MVSTQFVEIVKLLRFVGSYDDQPEWYPQGVETLRMGSRIGNRIDRRYFKAISEQTTRKRL